MGGSPVADTVGASPRTPQVSCQLCVPNPQLSALQAKAGICDLVLEPVQPKWRASSVWGFYCLHGHPILRLVTNWFASLKVQLPCPQEGHALRHDSSSRALLLIRPRLGLRMKSHSCLAPSFPCPSLTHWCLLGAFP